MRKLFFFEKLCDIIAETAKAFMPYFKVWQDGFIKRLCDADVVFCLLALEVMWKNMWKNWGRLAQKIIIDKQLQKGVRSGNIIIFNSVKTGNVWASKEAKLIICIALCL